MGSPARSLTARMNVGPLPSATDAWLLFSFRVAKDAIPTSTAASTNFPRFLAATTLLSNSEATRQVVIRFKQLVKKLIAMHHMTGPW